MSDLETERLAFEKQKWLDEVRLREREIAVREADARKSNWRSPLVVAISAAALAAFGNALITWFDGSLARDLEERRSAAQFQLEAQRSDSERILQVIESGDPSAVRNNLEFLIEAGLISDDALRGQLAAYLSATPDSRIPTLPQIREDLVPAARSLLVLSVGVADYKSPSIPNLKNPAFDARLVAAAARNQRGGIYRRVEVEVAEDATKAELIDLFGDLSAKADPERGDVAIIYFAGHAAQLAGELYMAPSDAELEDLQGTSLAVNEMAAVLKPLAATSHVILAIDACPGEEFESPAVALGEHNVTVILSSTPGTVCFDGAGSFGPFAQAFSEGFSKSSDRNGDGVVSVSELAGFVRTKTSELTDSQQVPFASLGFDGILLDGSSEWSLADASFGLRVEPPKVVEPSAGTQHNWLPAWEDSE